MTEAVQVHLTTQQCVDVVQGMIGGAASALAAGIKFVGTIPEKNTVSCLRQQACSSAARSTHSITGSQPLQGAGLCQLLQLHAMLLQQLAGHTISRSSLAPGPLTSRALPLQKL